MSQHSTSTTYIPASTAVGGFQNLTQHSGQDRQCAVQRPKLGVLQSMGVGATAGVIGISAVYPIDVVKTRMQGGASTSMVQIVRLIVKHESLGAFYKGLGPQIGGAIPDKAISLAARDYLKTFFSDPTSFQASVCAAAGAGMIQSVVMNPVEVVKVRMQLDSSLNLSGVLKELGAKGLYRGYSACLVRDVAFASLNFTLYDVAKKELNVQEGASLGLSMAAGSVAGMSAALISTPLDMAKTRMQAKGAAHLGYIQTFKTIYQQGGVKALFSGWAPRAGRIAPQLGIVLMCYDWLSHQITTAS